MHLKIALTSSIGNGFYSFALDNEMLLLLCFCSFFLNVIRWSMNLVHRANKIEKKKRNESVTMEMRRTVQSATGQMRTHWSVLFIYFFSSFI